MTEKQSTKIREYAEEMAVHIEELDPKYANGSKYPQEHYDKRLVIQASNECGHNGTQSDLIDILKHVKQNMPDLWESI